MNANLDGDRLALTLHGPHGVVDLVAPAGATVGEVAAEYAAHVGLTRPPALLTRAGTVLIAGATLARSGVSAGAVLVPAVAAPTVPVTPVGPSERGTAVHWVAAASVGAAGGGCALVAVGAGWLGWAPPAGWALVLVVAVLAARLVPARAVTLPDSRLLSPPGATLGTGEQPGRNAMLVPVIAVERAAARGRLKLASAGWATAAATVISAPALVGTAAGSPARIGAAVLVVAAGAVLLTAARRYPRPGVLQMAGVVATAAGAVSTLGLLTSAGVLAAGLAAGGAGAATVACAVAAGRGRRSVWWSARARQVEAVATAVTLAAATVPSGLITLAWSTESWI